MSQSRSRSSSASATKVMAGRMRSSSLGLGHGLGQLVLAHLRATRDVELFGLLHQLGLGGADVLAATGGRRAVTGRIAALGRLRVGGALLGLRLPVVTLLLEAV